ncbi:MAG: hypothetical protein KDA99_08980 [Planctomycetales bacterium]|nr:hypothetical protein [Planctomycetales bacterium]
MKFALLGFSPDVIPLVERLLADPCHELTAIVGFSQWTPELRAMVSSGAGASDFRASDRVALVPQWESLLHGTVADAVIVSADSTGDRDEVLRRLTLAAIPTLVVHPCGSAIVGFEVEMIRKDTGCALVPFYLELEHPLLRRLLRWSRDHDGPLGMVEQMIVQRGLPVGTIVKGRYDVRGPLALLSRDALLFRLVAGKIQHVAAMGKGNVIAETAGEWTRVARQPQRWSVHMASENGVMLQWSTQPLGKSGTGKIQVVGSRAMAELTTDPDPQVWTLSVTEDDSRRQVDVDEDSWNSRPYDIIDQFSKLCQHQTADVPAWEDACRALEAVEGAERSLQRGKRVEIYNEVHSEEETFKGMMAAGGCLALLGTLGVVLVMAVIDSLAIPALESEVFSEGPLRWLYWRRWPIYLLAALVVFLGLQFLRLVFPRPSQGRRGL